MFLVKNLLRCAAGILCSTAAAVAAAGALVPGDIYTSNNFSLTVKHFDSSGTYLNSFSVSPAFGDEVKGMTIGPDGLIYAVTDQIGITGFNVLALNAAGQVQATYTSSVGYVAGNLGYGHVAITGGKIFVAGADSVTAFTLGNPTGSVIYSNNGVFDLVVLPNGNLLVVSAYQINEITTAGVLVRPVTPDTVPLVDGRAIEFDPQTNRIYLAMLGSTGNFHRLMTLDGSTGHVLALSYFTYAGDLMLTDDHRLLIGSRTEVPAILDLDFNPLGTIGAASQYFLTAVPKPLLFVDGFEDP